MQQQAQLSAGKSGHKGDRQARRGGAGSSKPSERAGAAPGGAAAPPREEPRRRPRASFADLDLDGCDAPAALPAPLSGAVRLRRRKPYTPCVLSYANPLLWLTAATRPLRRLLPQRSGALNVTLCDSCEDCCMAPTVLSAPSKEPPTLQKNDLPDLCPRCERIPQGSEVGCQHVK